MLAQKKKSDSPLLRRPENWSVRAHTSDKNRPGAGAPLTAKKIQDPQGNLPPLKYLPPPPNTFGTFSSSLSSSAHRDLLRSILQTYASTPISPLPPFHHLTLGPTVYQLHNHTYLNQSAKMGQYQLLSPAPPSHHGREHIAATVMAQQSISSRHGSMMAWTRY